MFSISSDTLFSFLKNLMAHYKNYFSSSIVFNNKAKNPDHQQFKNTTKFSDKRLGDSNMQRLHRKGAERALPEHLQKSNAEVCAVTCAHIPETLQTTSAHCTGAALSLPGNADVWVARTGLLWIPVCAGTESSSFLPAGATGWNAAQFGD